MGYECPLNYNPADFFVHTLAIVPGAEEECRKRVLKICCAFRNSEEGKALEVGLNGGGVVDGASNDLSDANETEKIKFKYKMPWFAQFRAVFARCWIANLREPFIIKLRLFQSLVGVIEEP